MNQADIILRKPEHIYVYKGRLYPGVTTILEKTGAIKSQYYNDAARDFGERLHIYTELLDQGRLDWNSLREKAPEFEPWVKAWQEWRERENLDILTIETKVISTPYGYGGKLDRTWYVRGRPATHTTADLKSGGEAKWHRLQTAAYELARQEMDGGKRYDRAAVYLAPKAEDIRLVPHTDATDYDAWLGIVNLYNWEQKK